MATGFIVVFTSHSYAGTGVHTFSMVLIAIALVLFGRASRLRNEYYFGISSKGWSGMPTDNDFDEVFKRVEKSMNAGSSAKEAERDAELVELRREMKELRSQLKADSQAGRGDKPASETITHLIRPGSLPIVLRYLNRTKLWITRQIKTNKPSHHAAYIEITHTKRPVDKPRTTT